MYELSNYGLELCRNRLGGGWLGVVEGSECEGDYEGRTSRESVAAKRTPPLCETSYSVCYLRPGEKFCAFCLLLICSETIFGMGKVSVIKMSFFNFGRESGGASRLQRWWLCSFKKSGRTL